LPKWENSGTSPANPVINYANWKTFVGEPPSNYTYPDLDRNGVPLPAPGEGVSFYMGPRDTAYTEALRIPLDVIRQVQNGNLRLFLWGWAEYHDAFEGTPVHVSKFCNEVIVTGMGQENDRVTIAVSFGKYGPYNTAN
jgi:hypothetical protein